MDFFIKFEMFFYDLLLLKYIRTFIRYSVIEKLILYNFKILTVNKLLRIMTILVLYNNCRIIYGINRILILHYSPVLKMVAFRE